MLNFKHYSLARHYIVMSTRFAEPAPADHRPALDGPGDPAQQRLVELFDKLAPNPGITRSSFEGVNLMRANSPMPR
ncbi:AraC family transcriptional regulator, partial [Desulfobacter hydrogenophilus]|nr:AraC family transcriptional regulator [Desulfobacter hydrogenophilus]